MAYLGTKPANAVLTSEQIGDGVIATADLANSAVTQAKLGTNVAGTAPVFSAYLSTNQSVSNSTWTKAACNTEEFDTNSNYDTGNYRFTPTVAGYYQVNGIVAVGTSGITACLCAIYKNGVRFKDGNAIGGPTMSFSTATVSALIYFNGSTDYIELYGYVTSTTPLFYGGVNAVVLSASMVRAA
jgi:hypothetical protein